MGVVNIRQIIAAFVTAEEGLSVTEPRPSQVARIYPFLPPARARGLDLPCIMHQYRPMTEQRGPSGYRRRDYAVRIQLLVAKLGVDTDVWSEVAASYDEALVAALDGHVLLGEGTTYQRMLDFGGQEYQPTLMEWNGVPYVGSQYEYQVQARDTGSFAL